MLNFLIRSIFMLGLVFTVVMAAARILPRPLQALFGTDFFNEMLYVAHDGRSFGLQLEDHRAGLTVNISTPCIGIEMPEWSPDGNQIAYVGFCGAERAIQIIDTRSSSTPRTLTSRINALNYADPQWSPDGTRIAFQGRGSGSSNIYVVELATGEVMQITDDLHSQYHPSWSPQSDALVYESYRATADLLIYDFETNAERVLTDAAGAERFPAWSPDGQWIAYEGFDNDTGEIGIFFVRPDGSQRQLMIDSRANFEPEWTPDADMLYFRNTDLSAEGIYTSWLIPPHEVAPRGTAPRLSQPERVRQYQPFFQFRP